MKRLLTCFLVPPRPPGALPAHPLYFALPPRPRDSPIALPRSHWRQLARPRICRKRPRRRFARRHSQDPMALARRPQPRDFGRRRQTALDTLHALARRIGRGGRMDGRAGGRRQACHAIATLPTSAAYSQRYTEREGRRERHADGRFRRFPTRLIFATDGIARERTIAWAECCAPHRRRCASPAVKSPDHRSHVRPTNAEVGELVARKL
jgi:hypothetical protein